MSNQVLTSRLERGLWQATGHAGLIVVARAAIRWMPATEPFGRVLVSGPTFVGGINAASNCRALDESVDIMRRRGLTGAFHLAPFVQQANQMVRRATGGNHNNRQGQRLMEESFRHIMTEFYRGVLDSGLVNLFAFVHNWQSGPDCWWLRALASKQARRIVDLPPNVERWPHELPLNLTLATT